MRLEFWIDYVCPITYLTHKNLLLALEELNLDDKDIYYRSYPLTKELFEQYNKKADVMAIMAEHFPNQNFEFFDSEKNHQIAHLAKWHNLGKEYNDAILRRKFILGENISDDLVILDVAKEINLDLNEVKRVLETCCYRKQVNNNKANAVSRGIELIPHIRINIKNNFNGYYTKDELVKIISDIINSKPKVVTECAGEVCEY